MLHLGDERKNNEYKTINALWNALYLGARLITNNIQPYNDPQMRDFITIVDDIIDLPMVLERIKNGNQVEAAKYDTALEYCKENYGLEKASEAFNKLMNRVEKTTQRSILKRFELYTSDSIPSMERPIISEELSFAGKIERERIYRITCRRNNPKTIGICFARCADELARGTVVVKVQDENGDVICCEEKPFDNIVWNNWTYFEMHTAGGMINHVLKVRITCMYGFGSVGVGVFEVVRRQKKDVVLRRIHFIQPLGENVLFADC